MTKIGFSFVDYIVFSVMLVISALIGFYYAFKDRSKKNTDEFLLGGRKLQIFPVAMSIMASFTSAISILGFSQEMYRFGTMYWIIGFSYCLTQPFAAHVYVPLFHNLQITSAYEYLQLRFNYAVRVTASIIFCLQMFLYMAVVLYTPSVAIQQVTGLSLWVSILITGIVCTIYTTIGGIKAVIWTDTFQVFVMFLGLFAIIIKGSNKVGGFLEVLKRANDGKRLEFFDFNPNPFMRHSFWTLIFGGFLTSLTVYGSNQATIQRYLTMRTVGDAKKAMYINLIGTFSVLTVTCVTGLIAYAVYYKCDILSSKKVSRGEQILPYLVMDLLGNLNGVPGLFVACVYSAALSTVSSGLNSLAAVCLKDFIQPLYKNKEFPESKATNISKLLAGIFGILTVSFAYLCQYVGTTVLQISLSIFGLLGGPLLGVISLGMFCKFANSLGALCGLLLSTIVNLWLGIGAVLYNKPPKMKPLSVEECSNFNSISNRISYNSTYSTLLSTNTSLLLNENNLNQSRVNGFQIKDLYQISYLWFAGLSVIIVFVVGIVLSLLTGPVDPKKLDKKLFVNFNDLFCCCSKKDENENNYLEKKFEGKTNLAIELNEENFKNEKIPANDEICITRF